MGMHKGLLGQTEGGGSVGFDRIPAAHMPANVPDSREQTLGDYVQRKLRNEAFDVVANEKKLTFDEWWESAQEWVPFEAHPEKAIWEAAQENK